MPRIALTSSTWPFSQVEMIRQYAGRWRALGQDKMAGPMPVEPAPKATP